MVDEGAQPCSDRTGRGRRRKLPWVGWTSPAGPAQDDRLRSLAWRSCGAGRRSRLRQPPHSVPPCATRVAAARDPCKCYGHQLAWCPVGLVDCRFGDGVSMPNYMTWFIARVPATMRGLASGLLTTAFLGSVRLAPGVGTLGGLVRPGRDRRHRRGQSCGTGGRPLAGPGAAPGTDGDRGMTPGQCGIDFENRFTISTPTRMKASPRIAATSRVWRYQIQATPLIRTIPMPDQIA